MLADEIVQETRKKGGAGADGRGETLRRNAYYVCLFVVVSFHFFSFGRQALLKISYHTKTTTFLSLWSFLFSFRRRTLLGISPRSYQLLALKFNGKNPRLIEDTTLRSSCHNVSKTNHRPRHTPKREQNDPIETVVQWSWRVRWLSFEKKKNTSWKSR